MSDARLRAAVLGGLGAVILLGLLVLWETGNRGRGDITIVLAPVEPTPRTIVLVATATPQGSTPVTAGAVLNLNTASQPELEALPGIGPVLARAILDHRHTHGPYLRVEDLLKVPGIGEGTLARLRPHVRVS